MTNHRPRCPKDGEMLFMVYTRNNHDALPEIYRCERCCKFYKLAEEPVTLIQRPGRRWTEYPS